MEYDLRIIMLSIRFDGQTRVVINHILSLKFIMGSGAYLNENFFK